MAKPPREVRQPVDGGAAATVLDDFLTWTEVNRAEQTFTRYQGLLPAVHRRVRQAAGFCRR